MEKYFLVDENKLGTDGIRIWQPSFLGINEASDQILTLPLSSLPPPFFLNHWLVFGSLLKE